MTPRITVYTKVVGDLFHHGHARFFEQARKAGDRLVVHVVSDERVAALKQRRPIMTHQERLAVIQSCRWVDEVKGDGPKVITRAFMDEHNYGKYAFSYTDEAEKLVKRNDCPDLPEHMIVTFPYTQGISTTEILRRIRHAAGNDGHRGT